MELNFLLSQSVQSSVTSRESFYPHNWIVNPFAYSFAIRYWQRAVASKPSTAVKAFTLGGISWFAVPFAMATTMGLTAVALTENIDFPGYPSPLSATEVTAGLPAPAAASALMGKTGATLMLVVLFLAVVSTSAAEMVAVSNIATFDIYKRYINSNAEGKQILRVSKGTILLYAIVMGILGTIWYYIG